MTRPGIEPWSPGPMANTLATRTMDKLFIKTHGVLEKLKLLLCSSEQTPCDFFSSLGLCEETGLCFPPFSLQIWRNPSRESLLHWRLLLKTCYGMFGRCWTTNLTCGMSQAVFMKSTYLCLSHPNFDESIILLNIRFVEFHWPRQST